MNLSFHIARRYLVSKKSTNAINIISAISVAGVFVGTLALIVVLSVFNGFEQLVVSLYNAFDPDIKIASAEGKYISLNEKAILGLKSIEGVNFIVPVIEEKALIKYKDKQFIVTMKGVDSNFTKLSRLNKFIVEGEIKFKENGIYYAIFGKGVAYNLGLPLKDLINPVMLYLPRREQGNTLNPEDAFSTTAIYPSGMFAIQQEFDVQYIISDFNLMQTLLELPRQATSLELSIDSTFRKEDVQKQIELTLGKNYVVKNRFQQHELLYKIMKSEKWAVFLILAFILIIATFNVIGSLTMLILEKKKDIAILKSLGANNRLIKNIFLIEGMLITIIGAIAGLVAGGLICYAQQTFGFVSLGSEGSFVVDAYPVQMQFTDFLYVFFTVLLIGFTAAFIPARQLLKN